MHNNDAKTNSEDLRMELSHRNRRNAVLQFSFKNGRATGMVPIPPFTVSRGGQWKCSVYGLTRRCPHQRDGVDGAPPRMRAMNSAREFCAGKASPGTGTPRNWHKGSQPWL